MTPVGTVLYRYHALHYLIKSGNDQKSARSQYEDTQFKDEHISDDLAENGCWEGSREDLQQTLCDIQRKISATVLAAVA